MPPSDFGALRERLRDFRDQRDWSQFHNPKNLAMALAGEVGELSALLQWVPASALTSWLRDETNRSRLEDEVADVLTYLVYLADAAEIDLVEVGFRKVGRNEARYPVAAARGRADKYTQLTPPPVGSDTQERHA